MSFSKSTQNAFKNSFVFATFIFPLFYVTSLQAQYCTPLVTNKSQAYITTVTFSGMNNVNQSPAFNSTTGYQDYTNTHSARLIQGISSTLSVSINTYSSYDHRIYAYIDWDQDGDFSNEVGQPYILNATATTAGPHTIAITPPGTAPVGFTRMRLVVDADEDPASCGRASDGAAIWVGEYEDYEVELVAPSPFSYNSSTTTQESDSFVHYCSNNQSIIGVELRIDGTGTTGPINLTELQMNMNGSTRITDASNINIYYTGGNNSFSTTNLFATLTPANGTLIATGSQSLIGGMNYFWIAYDMITAHTSADTMDAECTQITVGGTDFVPTITAPGPGKKTISCPFTGECGIPFSPSYCNNEIHGSIEYIENVTVGTINNTTTHDTYGDYTALSTNMTAGTSYPITVRANTVSGGSGVGIYADWNADGDFNDANEIIIEVNTVPPATGWTTTITPPLTAINGSIRLRIVESSLPNLPLNPCGGSLTSSGDVEDYVINLTGGTPSSPSPNIPDGVAPPFTNGDFSTGDLTGWTASSGHHILGGNFGYPGGCCSGNTANLSFMSASDPNDACGGFPVVPPSLTSSIQLGNSSAGAQADRITQTFMVDSANSALTYYYAIVMNEPGHAALEQPIFTVKLRDANGCELFCSNYSATSGYDNQGFLPNSCSGEYLDWQSKQIDLYQYIGKDINIEVTMFDCAQGGHYGYAYFAATTQRTIVPLDSICIEIGTSVTLNAPSGYSSYLWSNSAVSQSITASPSVDTNYTVVATNDEGCATQTKYIVTTGCSILLNNDLLNFSISKSMNEKKAILNWNTNPENDIDYFILEKSADGIIFTPFATTETNLQNSYIQEDLAPYSGTSYYRVKLMHVNGQATFSTIKAIDIDPLRAVNIFPNPATNQFTIQGASIEQAAIVIHDLVGRKICDLPPLTGEKAQFYAGDLAQGVYIISVFLNGVKIKTQKLIIQD